jgi:hypothetical protein
MPGVIARNYRNLSGQFATKLMYEYRISQLIFKWAKNKTVTYGLVLYRHF